MRYMVKVIKIYTVIKYSDFIFSSSSGSRNCKSLSRLKSPELYFFSDVDAQILVCAECGEEFFCEELDNTTLVNTYHEYRRKHKLLLPEEIKKIREQYGLPERFCKAT